MYQNDVWRKVSVATIKQLRGSSYASRRRGSFLRGKDIKRREDVEKIDEDGGTPRRDRIEMVGDWNPRGESLSRGEKQAEWRRLSDRAYSPLCFRSQAWPAGERFPFFSRIIHANNHICNVYVRMNTHTHISVHARVSLCLHFLCLRVAHTEPSVFHPRGRLVDLPLRLSRYNPGSSYTRPSVLSPHSFVPSLPR